jgi:hypothetical protein
MEPLESFGRSETPRAPLSIFRNVAPAEIYRVQTRLPENAIRRTTKQRRFLVEPYNIGVTAVSRQTIDGAMVVPFKCQSFGVIQPWCRHRSVEDARHLFR